MATNKQIEKIHNIWLVTREYAGLAGAGGVKDVCRQLAEALARTRRRISVVLPCYGFMDPEALGFIETDRFQVDMNYALKERREEVSIHQQELNRVRIFLVDSERYREKRGIYTYTADEEAAIPWHKQGTAYFDYFAMNVLLQKSGLALMVRLGEKPGVIHCQDGHTAILPAMMHEMEGFRHYFRGTGAVVTIHNAGVGYHQEVEDLPFARAICGLPEQVVMDNLLADRFDPLLVASRYAVLNTVSENYARELQETEDDMLTGWLGRRLLADGVVLAGITNGINPADFDPRHPEKLGLAAAFAPGRGDLKGKKLCKKALLADINARRISGVIQVGSLAVDPLQPLFTMVGRLTSQKGVDILIDALRILLGRDKDFQVLLLGSGARELELALDQLALAPATANRICVLHGYDPGLANQVYAAGDFLLIPSRYEPCGLTDYVAQLAGNLPIVRHTGGLVKVIDGVTGLAYSEHSPRALLETMERALTLFREQPAKLAGMQVAAIRTINRHYTWTKVRNRYLELYRTAVEMTGDGGRKTEDGRRKTEDGRQRTEDRGQRTED
ncbi:MAG: glycogen/starch synthase [Desulfobacterales bacterium]|nr:glycogen/starch synthase [Desulfobacterales bacterium]